MTLEFDSIVLYRGTYIHDMKSWNLVILFVVYTILYTLDIFSSCLV